jgi:hypothetical protein
LDDGSLLISILFAWKPPRRADDRRHAQRQAQLLSYLNTTRLCLGLLINLKVLVLNDGIKRIVR